MNVGVLYILFFLYLCSYYDVHNCMRIKKNESSVCLAIITTTTPVIIMYLIFYFIKKKRPLPL